MDELKIMDMLRSFQRYFFMAAGDWADNFTEALCSYTAQHSMLHEHSAQSMLDSSFKGTSVEHDTYASKVLIKLQLPSAKLAGRGTSARAVADRPLSEPSALQTSSTTRSVNVDNSQLRAFESVCLSFEAAWPFSLIVTQVSLQHKCCLSAGCHSHWKLTLGSPTLFANVLTSSHLFDHV